MSGHAMFRLFWLFLPSASASASASPSAFVAPCTDYRRELYLFLLQFLPPPLFLFLLSRQKQQQVEFTAKVIAIIFQSLLASEPVPATGLHLFSP